MFEVWHSVFGIWGLVMGERRGQHELGYGVNMEGRGALKHTVTMQIGRDRLRTQVEDRGALAQYSNSVESSVCCFVSCVCVALVC